MTSRRSSTTSVNFLVIAAVAAIAWARVASASMCACMPEGSPESERNRSSDVFLGRVTEILGPRGNPHRLVRFEVLASWKGIRSDTLSLLSGGGACEFPFSVSRTYLVYGSRRDDGVLAVPICSRTRQVERAREDSIALGAPAFDRLDGRSWISFGPPTTCSVHGFPLMDGAWWYVADLIPDARREYPDWVKREAPFAGMPLQPQTRSDGKEFSLAGYATLCPMCREQALAWIRVSQEASTAPETGWDLPVRSGTETKNYRRRFPRAQFAIQYADGRQQYDSIESTFVRAFGSVRDTTVKFVLSDAELDALYEATVAAGLMDISTPHPAYSGKFASALVRTDRPSILYVRCGIEVRQFTWYEPRAPRDPSANSEWGRLVRVYRDVQRTLAGRAEVRALSPLPLTVDDPLREAASQAEK